MRYLYKLLCLIYSERCPYCSDLIKSEAIACDKCMKKLDKLQKPIIRGASGYRCVSSFLYAGSVKRLILNIKYNEKAQHIPQIAEIMVKDIRAVYGDIDFDCITYVPMHDKDIKKRGYNQAKLLANQIAKRMDLPCEETLLKIKRTKQQHKLKLSQRKTNLIGAFSIADNERVKGKNILLVDDIVTSGITLGTCCKTLNRAKPHMICCATIANSNQKLSDRAII